MFGFNVKVEKLFVIDILEGRNRDYLSKLVIVMRYISEFWD